MTRQEAFEAFLKAVDESLPLQMTTARDRIRQAGVEFAHAAAQEALQAWRDALREVEGRNYGNPTVPT